MKNIIINKSILLFVICIVFFVSCSSAPKNSGEVDVMRTVAETWLESGIKEAGQGRFDRALNILNDAKRYAILTDDSSLIIRVCLSLGNVYYSIGSTNEAFAQWNEAITESVRFKDPELIAAARIFMARGNLLSGRIGAAAVLEEVNRESLKIKKQRLYIAFSWQVKGLALRSLGSYTEAENAFKRSLVINEKDRYLENASYDWYSIASIRSLRGDSLGALNALESSMMIDRRIENSWGLAASYRAMGDVYIKMGRQNDAMESYRRARAIYVAMRNDFEIAEIDKKIVN